MKRTRILCASAAVAVLAGCGGGGGETTREEPDLGGPDATFGLLQQDYTDAFGRLGTATPTPLDQMPIQGSATYLGSAVYSQNSTPGDIRADPTSASRVQITTNFSDASVNGRLFNFRSANPDVAMSGELALNGIVSGNSVFGGLIPGIFDAPGGVVGDLTVDGVTEAQSGAFGASFIGSDHGALDGAVVFGPGGTPQTYGVFTAER